MKITTNRVPRPVIDAYELTTEERTQFDYVNWSAVDDGTDSASFFRYRGQLYNLGEFSSSWGLARDSGLPEWLTGWDGYISDSFFSGMVVKYTDDHESIIVGTFCE